MPATRVRLEVLRVEAPCPADWDAMAGDDRRRFCTGCRKHVHDLSALPRADAERLVCESAGELCVRFAQDAAGTVVTVDYAPPPPGRHRGWRFWTGLGLVGALFAGIAKGCARPGPAGGAAAMTVGMVSPSSRVLMGSPAPASQPSTLPDTGASDPSVPPSAGSRPDDPAAGSGE